MEKIISDILQELDKKQLYDNIESLWETELQQTYTVYTKPAKHTLEFIKKSEIENAEIINFKANDKTCILG
jgi:hypothetical protein